MITNPLDYRHKTGAKRRATDARAEQRTYDSKIHDPWRLPLSNLRRDLDLRQRLGARAHPLLTERIHANLRALARARRAGVAVPIADEALGRIVDLVAAKIRVAEEPTEEAVEFLRTRTIRRLKMIQPTKVSWKTRTY